MTYFIRNGSFFSVTDESNLDIHSALPPGNYVVKFSPMQGFFLDRVDDFIMPDKIYGDLNCFMDRIISTFEGRPNSTGVLLEGEKGSGKTLLAKALCVRLALEKSMPTLIVNTPFSGDGFNKFVQTIDQPLIMLFDEFEKVYPGEFDDEGDADLRMMAQNIANGTQEGNPQGNLLTLFDGVYPTRKLFIMTVNNRYAVNKHLKNRPGRIFYMLTFKGLEEDFIRQYCEENLIGDLKSHTNKVVAISRTIEQFNFDMLKALVEEMNRYNESPKESVKMLNIKPDSNYATLWICKFFNSEGNEVPNDLLDTPTWRGNPTGTFNINPSYILGKGKAKKWVEMEFDQSHFEKYDVETSTLYLENEKGERAELTRKQYEDYSARFTFEEML